MTPGKVASHALRNQPEMPAFFHEDRVGRDAFLSQIGHFSEEQRDLFNQLCDMWEPDISYNAFLAKVESRHRNTAVLLDTVMALLERGRCGLITTTVQDGHPEKDRLILTDRDAPRFWYWLVEKTWEQCGEDSAFPVAADLQKKGFSDPEILHPLSIEDVTDSFIADHRNEVVIYTLRDWEEHDVVATPASLEILLDAARSRIRFILSGITLQSTVARFMGTVVSRFQEDLKKNNDRFWNALLEAITVHRADLLAKRSHLPSQLFTSAQVLKLYIRKRLMDEKRRAELNAEMQQALKVLFAKLIQNDNPLMSSGEFEALFQPYENDWPDLRTLFETRYMRSADKTQLPLVATMGSYYIHRNRIFPLFKSLHGTACAEFRQFYLERMKDLLWTGKKGRGMVLASADAFRHDISSRLVADFPALSELLSHPRSLAQGIVEYAVQVLKISDKNKVKHILGRYFQSGMLLLKNPEELFNLPFSSMLEEAFRRLSWLRRTVVRLLGRYDGCKQLFAAESFSTTRSAQPLHSRRENFAPLRRPAPEKMRKREANKPSVHKKNQVEVEYPEGRADEAWREFRNAYSKGREKE